MLALLATKPDGFGLNPAGGADSGPLNKDAEDGGGRVHGSRHVDAGSQRSPTTTPHKPTTKGENGVLWCCQ